MARINRDTDKPTSSTTPEPRRLTLVEPPAAPPSTTTGPGPDAEDCQECDGTGTIEIHRLAGTMERRCETCDGDGYTYPPTVVVPFPSTRPRLDRIRAHAARAEAAGVDLTDDQVLAVVRLLRPALTATGGGRA